MFGKDGRGKSVPRRFIVSVSGLYKGASKAVFSHENSGHENSGNFISGQDMGGKVTSGMETSGIVQESNWGSSGHDSVISGSSGHENSVTSMAGISGVGVAGFSACCVSE